MSDEIKLDSYSLFELFRHKSTDCRSFARKERQAGRGILSRFL